MFTPAICFSKLIPPSSLAMLSSYDNTLFASAQNDEKLIKSLQSTLNGVLECYQENCFKGNADKFYLFWSPYSNTEIAYCY